MNSASRRVVLTGVVLALYWVALFVATHIPLPPTARVPVSDKTLHLAAYAVLGLLLAATWYVRRPFRWRPLVLLLLVLAAYGALDELLQDLVGRQCDPLDWLADVAGAALGLLAYGLWRQLRPATARRR